MMQFSNTYVTEFLAEFNLVLTQENNGNQLFDVLTPVKNLIQYNNELLTFSLVRYTGGSVRQAFLCEIYYQTHKILLNTSNLYEENKKHLLKRVRSEIKEYAEIENLVDNDIRTLYLPMQLTFLQTKSQELIDEQVQKNSHLNRFLSRNFLSQFMVGEVAMHKSLYNENLTLHQIIDMQSSRSSFLLIALPCFVGFINSFYQPDSIFNPKGVKWAYLETIFKQLASIHQMNDDIKFKKYIYEQSLNEDEVKDWYSLSLDQQYKVSEKNNTTTEVIDMIREKIYEKTLNDMQSLVFPQKHKDMMLDLLEWVYKIKSAQS